MLRFGLHVSTLFPLLLPSLELKIYSLVLANLYCILWEVPLGKNHIHDHPSTFLFQYQITPIF